MQIPTRVTHICTMVDGITYAIMLGINLVLKYIILESFEQLGLEKSSTTANYT